ncbi:MAG: anti-phage BREX system Lon protease BrxL [Thermomicrobiales bacterium]
MQADDHLDRKANDLFAGKVVRKDLVRRVKVGANAPNYVLEFLLGKYCATDDPIAIELGLEIVNETLAKNVIRPDEAMKAQSRLRERGPQTFIDKIKVRLVESEDKYWAELTNFGNRYIHIPESAIQKYERLLEGGMWAEVKMEYHSDESAGGQIRPFFIREIRPIQLASFDLEEYRQARSAFTTDEWMDLLLRSIGMEPSHFDQRLKLLFLLRLIPMVERNYNSGRAGTPRHWQEFRLPRGVSVFDSDLGWENNRR